MRGTAVSVANVVADSCEAATGLQRELFVADLQSTYTFGPTNYALSCANLYSSSQYWTTFLKDVYVQES